jgi:transcription elongation factor GreA
MTEHIKKKLQEEINALEHELSHELPRELKKAVALGDLSENAEYHMAKQRQEFVKARLRQLGKRIADLSLINLNNIPKDKSSTSWSRARNQTSPPARFRLHPPSDVRC